MDARTAQVDETNAAAVAALEGLSARVAAQALAAACDLVLVLDAAGVIREIRIGVDDLANIGIETWLNRPWIDTIASDNRNKIEDMLSARAAPPRWRQVNHQLPGVELPMRYMVIDAGDGLRLAIGRDLRAAAAMQQRLLRAQQAMERDSLRLRQLEARYRLLFESAPEAILVIDSGSRRIAEANPAARRLVPDTIGIEGQLLSVLLHPDDREAAAAALGAVAAGEQRLPERLRLADGAPCQLGATLFRQDRSTHLLVRLRSAATDEAQSRDRPLAEVLERMPDAFVLTDGDFAILASNGAFLDLVQAPRGEDVRGMPLSRWLGRPGIDVALLEAQLKEHGAVSSFATIVRGTPGSEIEVEVSAVKSAEAGAVRNGFTIRTVGSRIAATPGIGQPRSVEQLTELVGRVSLKEIVRESTDLIERLCIEAALAYTDDNRASAAEILGLSRQSLYSKLHRHGLGNLGEPD